MLNYTAFSASNDLLEANMTKFQEKVVDPCKFLGYLEKLHFKTKLVTTL